MVTSRPFTVLAAGILTSVAMTLIPTAVQAAPAPRSAGARAAVVATVPTPPVRGHLDGIQAGPGRIRVTGWSFDRRRPGVANSENVVVDGRMSALPMADRPRPDVNSAFRIPGRHGFDVAVAARPGDHRVCVVSRPAAGSGSTWLILGCRAVRVPSGPGGA